MSNIQKSNVNAIKVTYNPYVKQFSYGVWNTEKRQFDELKVGNDLHDKDYYKSGSLHVKAFDIVNKINKMYNKNDRQHSILKTDILFSGTKEDEEYFRQVTEKYFHHVTPKLNVVPADTGFYSSNKVKEKIDCIFKNIEKEIKSFIGENDQDIIKYQEIIRPAVPICVIGTYSAGKSSLINSLLGFELLEGKPDPTTARVYKISITQEEKANKISFSENGEKITVEFGFSEKEKLYNELKELNSNKEKKISEQIEISLAANSLFIDSPLDLKNHNYIIYDTPGSDAANYKEHFEILKNALKGQTDGLLIFATTADGLDKDGLKELVREAQSLTESSLDKHSILVVINKADQQDSKTLKNSKEKIKDNKLKSAIKALKPAGYYFVSSAIGLGFKKNESKWMDEVLRKAYKTQKNTFYDLDDEDYTELYKHNIMPQYEYDNYCIRTENSDKDKRSYYNSGLHCLETAICDFADNSALLIKCRNACKCLEAAIKKCSNEIQEKQNKIENKNDEINKNLSKAYQELKKELKKKGDEELNKYAAIFSSYITSVGFSYGIGSIFNDNNVKKYIFKKRDEEKIRNMLNNCYVTNISNYKETILRKAGEIWRNAEKEFKEECIKIVTNSDNLKAEDKTLLSTCIMNLQLSSYNVPKLRIHEEIYTSFLIFLKRLNIKGMEKEYNNQMRNDLTNINNDVINKSKENFKTLQNKIYETVEQIASDCNPKIKKLIQERERYEKEIESIKLSQNQMKEYSDKIKSLITPKKREEINNE